MEYGGCWYTADYGEQWDSVTDMEYGGCGYTAYYGEQWDSETDMKSIFWHV